MADQKETPGAAAMRAMKQAHEILFTRVGVTHESKTAVTRLEEAMMWCNKYRAKRGELKPNETHV